MSKKKIKSLRRNTIIIFSFLFFILIFSNYILLNTLMMDSIDQLEHKSMNENMKRAINALDLELVNLSGIVESWGPWDETYKFIENGNEKYIKTNLDKSVFNKLRIDLMIFINESGEFVYIQKKDFENKNLQTDDSQLQELFKKAYILNNKNPEYKVSGIIVLSDKPMLIVSCPILKSDYQGPVHGNLVIGRYLDNEVISKISKGIKLDISLETLIPDDQIHAQILKLDKSNDFTTIHEINKEKIHGHTVLHDIYKEPALALILEMHRDVRAIGIKGIAYVTYSLFAIGLIFIFSIICFLEKNILSRLQDLSQEVLKIGNEGLLSLRIKPQKKLDEIGILTQEINLMLDKLEISENELQKSEGKYRTLVEKVTDIIYAIDTFGICTYISPNWPNVVEYNEKDIIGKHFTHFMHPDFKDSWYLLLKDALLPNEQKEMFEYKAKMKDGSWRWFGTKISFIPGNGNRQSYYIGIIYDIHKRKLVEDALLKAHNNLEKTVQDRTIELTKTNKLLQNEIGERKKMQEKMTHLAYHDHLTGLPNRSLFVDRLEQAIFQAQRLGKNVGIFFIDLDEFKVINDTMGHDLGDELLKKVSNRLRDSIRKSDTVCRIGGDEFIILVQNLENPDDTIIIAKKIIESFRIPFYLNKNQVRITVSVGVSIYPKDGNDVNTIIKNADIAMYKAKENGKNQFILYSNH
jgi:diguanylate cyclase (GGDEF)-like protein/PAS domain S-box-containing protein